MFQFSKLKRKGFTLVELLVVIAIVGLLSSIVLVATKRVREKAEIIRARNFDAQVHHALGAYLVAEYKFEDNLKDTSGNNHHGTWKETGGEPPGGNFVNNTLLGGKALELNGIDEYVNIGKIPALEYGSFNVTISAWIYWKGGEGGNYDGILGYYDYWYKGYDFYICIYPALPQECDNGEVAFWYTGYSTASTAPAVGLKNEWHFVAGTYNGTYVSIYVDGILKDTGEQKEHYSYDEQVGYIGWGQEGINNFENYFKGIIDEVRIYQEELTSAQIQKLYVEGAEKRGLLAKE